MGERSATEIVSVMGSITNQQADLTNQQADLTHQQADLARRREEMNATMAAIQKQQDELNKKLEEIKAPKPVEMATQSKTLAEEPGNMKPEAMLKYINQKHHNILKPVLENHWEYQRNSHVMVVYGPADKAYCKAICCCLGCISATIPLGVMHPCFFANSLRRIIHTCQGSHHQMNAILIVFDMRPNKLGRYHFMRCGLRTDVAVAECRCLDADDSYHTNDQVRVITMRLVENDSENDRITFDTIETAWEMPIDQLQAKWLLLNKKTDRW